MDETTTTTNGYRQYLSSRAFLQINLGHVLIIVGMAATAIWWFVTYDRAITETKYVVTAQAEAQKTITGRVEAIDNGGTRFSQRNIDKELDVLKLTSERITKLEALTTELVPRVDKMTYQVASIAEWVEDQKKKQRNAP